MYEPPPATSAPRRSDGSNSYPLSALTLCYTSTQSIIAYPHPHTHTSVQVYVVNSGFTNGTYVIFCHDAKRANVSAARDGAKVEWGVCRHTPVRDNAAGFVEWFFRGACGANARLRAVVSHIECFWEAVMNGIETVETLQ